MQTSINLIYEDMRQFLTICRDILVIMYIVSGK